MHQTSNAGAKTLTEHGELMLQTAFDDLAEWCYKLIECYTYADTPTFTRSHAHSICKQHQLKEDGRLKAIWTDLDSKYQALPKADIDKLKARMRDLLIYNTIDNTTDA